MSVFHDYNSASAHFKGVRTPSKGKPVRSFGRLFFNNYDKSYDLYVHGRKLLCLSPDNTLTFTLNETDRKYIGNTLSMALDDCIPFVWERKAVNRYLIFHLTEPRHQQSWDIYRDRRKDAQEYFEGIQFNMLTGECLNPRPPFHQAIVPEIRKAWLTALRKWKRGLKVRVKVGGFDDLIRKSLAAQANLARYRTPVFDGKVELDILYRCIKNNEHPTDMMRMIVDATIYSLGYYRGDSVTKDDVLKYVETMLTARSMDLRKRFGVFGEEHING